ncbi:MULTISPECIES: triphosphoribosyl-dephospho-CoA synthase CitG [unclassified Enterococcus]|uniref:triphosphoribosyl-dephospho-CoA synthase CitG n=1 Tax=unclassified Enterococcus TaxID=2608891 RepID=UPI0013EBAB5D|nr:MULTISPECIES: triphosphoribosyl-dephospho-CoA synthase CitG [unclassified Enterococcus]
MISLLTKISGYAEKALLYEVSLTPKPGLVDRRNSGAHQDMDFFTFIDSIVSLSPFFQNYVEAGFYHEGPLPQLFDQLREIGKKAETAMLEATNGVNTHKGANFSFAVLLGATGFYLQTGAVLPFERADSEKILQIAGQMTSGLLEKDFHDLASKTSLTYGEKLYHDQGVTGIRGEAASGYPSLKKLLHYLRQHEEDEEELTFLRALIYLMSEVEDSNLLHRGGLYTWKKVQAESRKIHQANLQKLELIDQLRTYDQLLIKRNLSPGGSADLLSLGIYFSFLEGSVSPEGKKV